MIYTLRSVNPKSFKLICCEMFAFCNAIFADVFVTSFIEIFSQLDVCGKQKHAFVWYLILLVLVGKLNIKGC